MPRPICYKGTLTGNWIDGGNAVTAYNKALSLDPKLAEAKYKIGKIYLTQNNKEYFSPGL